MSHLRGGGVVPETLPPPPQRDTQQSTNHVVATRVHTVFPPRLSQKQFTGPLSCSTLVPRGGHCPAPKNGPFLLVAH